EMEVDSISAYGLTGTDRTVSAGEDYRDAFTLGPVTTQSGRYHGQRWRVNENGIVVYEIGVHKKNEIDAQALRSATNAPTTGVTLAGEVQQPVDAYVLKVNPPNGRLEWLYIDKKTSLLDREDDAYPDKRLTITYDDYRAVDGMFEPWHTHMSDGYPANEVDVRIQSDDVNIKFSDDYLKIPSGDQRIATFPANASSVVLPARIDDGSVVVRLTINGRGLDFLLDSGASGILMDNEVAKELGIKTFGESVQTTMGAYESTQAIVPEMDVGPIALHNTYVECVPFTQQLGYDTKIVGLLGFDFIANAVVSINYDNGNVTAAPPDSFSPPVNSIAVPIALDDGVPFVQVQIGDSIGTHFILDTGADMIVIFSEFAAAHPQDVVDQGLGKSLSKYLPFVTAEGVGGQIQMTMDQLASYHFGSVNFTDFLAYRTQSGSAFESEDTDGLVGYEVLQYFTVTFDYKDGMIYLIPGEVLRSRQAAPTPTPHPKAKKA
ncbi:MAG TPA: aspartyl protease family protein, partial [Candidatus Eremiobacteraceae bacterium]|nr:aspartyl protease family protein [Candidatus Eremiobacteraceae bacterium]